MLFVGIIRRGLFTLGVPNGDIAISPIAVCEKIPEQDDDDTSRKGQIIAKYEILNGQIKLRLLKNPKECTI